MDDIVAIVFLGGDEFINAVVGNEQSDVTVIANEVIGQPQSPQTKTASSHNQDIYCGCNKTEVLSGLPLIKIH